MLTYDEVPAALPGIATGFTGYCLTLRTLHYACFKIGLHSRIPGVSSLAGVACLTGSNLVATQSMVMVNKQHLSLTECVTSTLCHLTFYRVMLRQSFYTVLPSHVVLLGSFAKQGIQLNSVNVTKAKRANIQKIGAKYGCHHCGVKTVKYIADHMPPTATVGNQTWQMLCGKRQAIYPQCYSCCSLQAGVMSASRDNLLKLFGLNRKGMVLHRRKLFCYYLWFPFYFVAPEVCEAAHWCYSTIKMYFE